MTDRDDGWGDDTPVQGVPVDPPKPSTSAQAAFRAIDALRQDFSDHAQADADALAKLDKKLDARYDGLEQKIEEKMVGVMESHNGLAREVSELTGSFKQYVEAQRSDDLSRRIQRATAEGVRRAATDADLTGRVEATKRRWTLLEKVITGIFAVIAVLIPILAAKC